MDNINKLLNIDKTKAKMNRTQPCLYYKSKPYYALQKQTGLFSPTCLCLEYEGTQFIVYKNATRQWFFFPSKYLIKLSVEEYRLVTKMLPLQEWPISRYPGLQVQT